MIAENENGTPKTHSRRIACRLISGLLALACAAGLLQPAAQDDPTPDQQQAGLTDQQRREMERLEALGYLGGTEEPLEGATGVVFHDEQTAYPGLNFFTSGHGPEAFLVDMQGKELHRWRYQLDKAFPEETTRKYKRRNGWWRRAHMFENGDLLAIFEGRGLIKLNKDSELIWASRVRAHHDLKVLPDGDIYVLTREVRIADYMGVEQLIIEDFVSILDADGIEKRRVSLLVGLEKSEVEPIPRESTGGDIFHTNSLAILDGSIADSVPAFRRGNILTSFRNLNAIAVLDLEQESLVWVYAGDLTAQHDPEVLPNGNILLFDNRTEQQGSRVIELDPETLSTLWQYSGTDDEPFFSQRCGTAQRLANGNTLITETGRGRAFEVTPEKKIVWEYRSPFRVGKKRPRVARLAEVLRLPLDYPTNWLASDGD